MIAATTLGGPALRSRRQQAGVSLLEVIVALVIVASFGAALFSWAGQTYKTASRAVEISEEVELERNLIELAQSINPASRADGKLETETHIYEWHATMLRPLANHAKHPAGISPYQVALYRMSIRVSVRASGTVVLERERQIAGFVGGGRRASLPGMMGSEP